MGDFHNPRSTLHTLSPMGLGTPDVESLTSYFCRLAHSHSMTARNLAIWVRGHFGHPTPDEFKWYRRSFSGMSAESEECATWLAELTGVGELERLTLTPWRHLVASSCLAPKTDRWCPACFQEDMASGRPPYLRLSWEVAPVTVCARHKCALVSACPRCQKTNIRNRASTVVPGYCTACGEFLGATHAEPATPDALWVARQVGTMLADVPRVSADGLTGLLGTVIEQMASGRIATFAKQLELTKSGVWYWLNKGVQPGIHAWLAIALHGGIGLDKLFAGDLDGWTLPMEPVQIPIPLPTSPRKGIKGRELDWEGIRAALRSILQEPTAITLGEACQRVGADYKQLYQKANREARAIADRYRRHRASVREEKEGRLQEQLGELLQARRKVGYEGMSAREVLPSLDPDLQSVRNLYRHIGVAVAAND